MSEESSLPNCDGPDNNNDREDVEKDSECISPVDSIGDGLLDSGPGEVSKENKNELVNSITDKCMSKENCSVSSENAAQQIENNLESNDLEDTTDETETDLKQVVNAPLLLGKGSLNADLTAESNSDADGNPIEHLLAGAVGKIKRLSRSRRGSADLSGSNSRRNSRSSIDSDVEERRSRRLQQKSQERELETKAGEETTILNTKKSKDDAANSSQINPADEKLSGSKKDLLNSVDSVQCIGVTKQRRRYSRFERFDDEDAANSTATEEDDSIVDDNRDGSNKLSGESSPMLDNESIVDSASVTIFDADNLDQEAKQTDSIKEICANGLESVSTDSEVLGDNTSDKDITETDSKDESNSRIEEMKTQEPGATSIGKSKSSHLSNSHNSSQSTSSYSKRKSFSPQTHRAKKSFTTTNGTGKKLQRAKMSLSPNRLSSMTIDSFFKPVGVQGQPTARKSLAYTSTCSNKPSRKNSASAAKAEPYLPLSMETDDVPLSPTGTTISPDAAATALSALQTDKSNSSGDKNVAHLEQYVSDAENNPIALEKTQLSKCVKMPKARKSFPRSNVPKDSEAGSNDELWTRGKGSVKSTTPEPTKVSSETSGVPSKTFKLKDLESVFGISKKLEKKLDGKTLDKMMLERALKHKDKAELIKNDSSKRVNIVSDRSCSKNVHVAAQCLSNDKSTIDNGEELQDAASTNFASLLTTQRILTKRRRRKRGRLGTYNLPSCRRKKPVKKPRTEAENQTKSNLVVGDCPEVEISADSDTEVTSLDLSHSENLSPEKSIASKGRRRKAKKKKIPKYIRARLRDMQKRIHMQGQIVTEEIMEPGLDTVEHLNYLNRETSRKRKRISAVDDDSISVASNATSVTESEVSMYSKESQGSKRRRTEDSIPSLSPVSDIPIVNQSQLSNSLPPKISPQKICGRSIFKPSPNRTNFKLAMSRGLECLDAVPSAVKRHIESAGGADGNKFDGQLSFKFHNTPNGITYPVTPPHTPEHGLLLADGAQPNPAAEDCREIQGSDGRSDYVPVCCCKVTMVAGPLPPHRTHLYCQALDSVNGKIMGCCNKVTNAHMVRPAQKIPFMVLCDVHRQRLRSHQCCPGCGQFCTEGKFLQCKSAVNSKGAVELHHYHVQCQTLKTDKLFCPHCANESQQYQVILKYNGPRTSWSAVEVVPPSLGVRPSARMGGIPAPSLRGDVRGASGAEVPISASNKVLSAKPLPLGPTREELEATLSILDSDRAKKLRPGAKNLYKACRVGDLEKVIVMLADGADPNLQYEDENNKVPLHAASGSGHHLIVHLLLQAGANPQAQDNTLATPVMLAAEKGHTQVLQILVKSGALVDAKRADGMTSLHLAAQSGKVEAVRFLLETKKIQINVKDDGGWTSLIWAAEHSHLDVVHYLLDSGADPNIRDNEGNTALHWAAFSGSTDIAEIFLNAGCNLEAVNELGDRPLHITSRQDHYECVVLFLARGADSEARNNQNEAAISCCVDPSTPTWMALRVNRQLQGVAARTLQRPDRLLHRDISYGREANPMPVVNMVDDENYPTDFHYVADNVETTPMNVNRVITSLQACKCKENCGSVFCECSHNSVKCWFEKDGKLVKDFSYSDPPLIFECNKACRCWSTCQNRVVQLGVMCRLQVFRTDGRGWGARTLLDIPQGSFVCEYIGELISDAEADSREDDSYLFDLDNKDTDTYCIDARRYGNIARFINHLCQPNLIPVKVFIEHQDLRFPRICFFASRDIKASEELGFDYGEKFWIIKWKQFTCTCGSPKCRYSKDTIHKTLEEYYRRQREEEQLVEQQ